MHDAIEITMLGSGTSAGVPMIGCHCPVCTSEDPRDRRTRPSIVITYEEGGERHNILVDTSPELRVQAVREKLDRLSAVVYTHAHADHIFGLDDVRRYNTLMGKPLPLYAAGDAMATLRRAFAYAFETPPPLPPGTSKDAIYRPELIPTVIDESRRFDLLGKTWTPIPMTHGRFRVLGFRIGDFAYCTDCNDIPSASRALLGGLDVLIIDALRPRPHPTHLSFEQAVALAGELSPRPRRVIFTHLSHDMKHADIERWLAGLGTCRAGMEIHAGFDGLKMDSPC